MKVYVNRNTGVEVRSQFVIAGDDWREVTPAESPVLPIQEAGKQEEAKQKAVRKNGSTVRNKK